MQLFHSSDIEGQRATIHDQEAKHVSLVLRKKQGDKLHLTDGNGGKFLGEIIELSKRKVVLDLIFREQLEPSLEVHLAVAPTKNTNRLEWLIEKACEIGITQFTPIITAHSERKKVNQDKIVKKSISASLQSLKYYFPQMNPLTGFDRFLNEVKTEQKCIAYCGSEDLSLLIKNLIPQKSVTILIGPEGDFSPAEFEKALKAGFTGVSLGNARLRTETAGIVATTIIQQVNA